MGAGNVWHVPLSRGGTVPGVRAPGDRIPHAVSRGMSTGHLQANAPMLGVGVRLPALLQGDVQRLE